MFSARFDKQDGEDQVVDETESCNNSNNNRMKTDLDIDKIYLRSQLEQQIQNHEKRDSGWKFDKIISRTIYFYKTTEMNKSNYIKVLLRYFAKLNIQNEDKHFFLWSFLAQLYPCEFSHSN